MTKPSRHQLETFGQQLSSGLILGLIQVIFAVSYAALMFSGRLRHFIAYAMTVTLITATAGGLYGLFSQEPTFISGPGPTRPRCSRASWWRSLRFPPRDRRRCMRPLRCCWWRRSPPAHLPADRALRRDPAGALHPVPGDGRLPRVGRLADVQRRAPSLPGHRSLAGVTPCWTIRRPNSRRRAAGRRARLDDPPSGAAMAIPLFIAGTSIAINLLVREFCPPSIAACSPDRWFFAPFQQLEWLPPWQLQLDSAIALELLRLLPSFAVAFVGTLTVLLSLSSLELTYRRDFKLEPALRLHGWMTIAAALGGYLGVISIGRSTMCRQTGGGRWSGLVIAAVCLAVLFGLGGLMAWIPKVSLGALVLYLGVGMLRQWLWDLRRDLRPADLLQVVSILVCVIVFGYVVGFLAGLLAACIFFVVNYSHMPSIRLKTPRCNRCAVL